MSRDPKELAMALIRGIQNELANGTKHFNAAGEELTDVKSILKCLTSEGKVELEPTKERQHLFKTQ